MATNIFLAYTTDDWHTEFSKSLIGAAANINTAIELCRGAVDNIRLNEEDIQQLIDMRQTQGYRGNGEFIIEETELIGAIETTGGWVIDDIIAGAEQIEIKITKEEAKEIFDGLEFDASTGMSWDTIYDAIRDFDDKRS
jgi:hypothetical protein